jgi:hypothetical protein
MAALSVASLGEGTNTVSSGPSRARTSSTNASFRATPPPSTTFRHPVALTARKIFSVNWPIAAR